MTFESKICTECGKEILRTQAEIGLRNTGPFHLSCWNDKPEEDRKKLLEMTKF